jgi:hypothetical protein
MTITVDQTIAACYVAFFGRSPDQNGLQFWEAAAQNSGKSGIALTEAIATGFANNPSFASTYQGMGNGAFVTAIYQNIGGTAPDAAGAAYWTNLLNQGQSRAQVVADFVYGVLNMSAAAINAQVAAGTITQAEATAALQRQAYLTNKANVGLAFTQALGAGSNLAAGTDQTSLASLQKDPAYVASQAILNSVDSTQASVTAVQTFLNNSPTTSSILAAYGNGVGATTVTLTTGVDSITASGNAVINGVIGTAANNVGDTLNPLDSIKATGANNTLNIVDQGNATSAGVIPTITVSGVQTANISAVGGETVNTTNWTGLTALNINASNGADVVKAAGATAVNVTDTLAIGATAVATPSTTVDGGSTVTVTATGTSATGKTFIGNVTVGGTTAPTGAVTVTSTETSGVTGTTFGNVTVTGAAAVTVNATENAGFAATAAQAGNVSATGGTGVVTVTNTTNITDTTSTDTIVGAAVVAKGGSSIVINDVVTASAAANAAVNATAVTAQDGAVTVLDGGTATSVTVNQTVTKAVAAKAAAAAGATGAAGVAGGPGFSASASTLSAAKAAVSGVLGVTANSVQIGGADVTGQALADASNTITSVSLNNYGTGSFINSTVLNTVTLAGSGTGGLTIDNVGTTPFTTLGVNLNGFTDTTGLTDQGVKTLNIVTGGTTGSTLGGITDTSLATINVSGTQTLTLTAPAAGADAALKAIVVSGAAGFNDNGGSFALTAAGTTLTTTSSGAITATLHAAGTDTFTGSTGKDTITITADQTKAVTAGSAAGNEIVLGAAASTFQGGAGHTWGSVSGFTTLGINSAIADGTYNAAAMGSNTINAVEIISGTGTVATISNVAKNASLSIDQTNTTAAALVYQSVDATGAGDVVTLNLGTTTGGNIVLGTATVVANAITAQGADTGATGLLSSLVMEDANQVGIGTLNIVSNDTAAGAAAGGHVNVITALADSGLSTLNVSGVDGLAIGALNEGATLGATATAASSFTLNNTSGGAVTIGTFTDSALGNLNFSGTGNSVISNLAGVTGHVLTISNTGTGTATVTSFGADANLNSLTLTGNVALNADNSGSAPAPAAATGATTGVTVSGATDNAHVNFTLTGAAAGATDSITLGNGNNYVTDGSTAGLVNVTVGTGSNLIDLSAGGGTFNTASVGAPTANNTYSAAVTLGAHTAATGSDVIKIGLVDGTVGGATTAWTFAPTAAANTVITGAVAGDHLVIADATSAVNVTTAQQTAITSASSLANALSLAFGETAQHAALSFQYGGNTYVVEQASATNAALAAGDTIVQLVGAHTLSSTVTAGHVVLAS